MIVKANQGPGDTFHCFSCRSSLVKEENVVGFAGRAAHDIYRCPHCQLLHWAERQPAKNKLAS